MGVCKLKTSLDYAQDLDKNDDLASLKEEFYLQENIIYMDGNSLGAFIKTSRKNFAGLT